MVDVALKFGAAEGRALVEMAETHVFMLEALKVKKRNLLPRHYGPLNIVSFKYNCEKPKNLKFWILQDFRKSGGPTMFSVV